MENHKKNQKSKNTVENYIKKIKKLTDTTTGVLGQLVRNMRKIIDKKCQRKSDH